MNAPRAQASPPVRAVANEFSAERVRADFPILAREVNGRPLVYLDSAASAQQPRAVLDAIEHYATTKHANVHRGVHTLSQEATAAFEGAPVHLSTARTGDGGDVVDGVAPAQARGQRRRQLLVDDGWRGRRSSRRAGQHDDVLAPRLAGGGVEDGIAEGAAPQLLVQLRQLPGEHDRSVSSAHRGELGERPPQAMGSLVQHDGAGFDGDVRETGGALGSLAGKEAFEHEAAGGETADDDRGDGGGRAGHGAHVMTSVERGTHQPLARIGEPWRARVGHHGHGLSGVQPAQHLLDLTVLGVLVHDQHPGAGDAEVVEKASGAAGVFARDHVAGAQQLDRSFRQVAQVADGGGDEHEQPRGRCGRGRAGGHARSSTRSPTFRPQRSNAPARASTI